MADIQKPVRRGETLGDYYYWALDLSAVIDEHNQLQADEREWAASKGGE